MNSRPALLGLIAALALFAGCQRHQAPAAIADDGSLPPVAASPAWAPPVPVETTFANGLRVIVVPSPGRSLVAIDWLLASGSEIDPPGQAGLADFTATALTLGSRAPGGARTAAQLADAAEALGGTLRAGAGWDASRIGITVTAPKLAAALELLAEVLRYPAFAADDIARLRVQTVDSLRLRMTDPADIAAWVAARRLHGAGAYGHPASGTAASVSRFTVASVRALQARHYRPDNSVLVLTGDLAPDTGIALAAQLFGDWLPSTPIPTAALRPAIPAATAEPQPAPSSADAEEVLVIDQPDAGQATVMLGTALPPGDARARDRAQLLTAVLGGGYSSRLNQEIRIRRGLSYGARAELDLHRGMSALYASAQTKNAAAAEVLAVMRQELLRLSTETVPEAELSTRKAALAGRTLRALQTADGLADAVATQLAEGSAVSGLSAPLAGIEAVTAMALRQYAQQQLIPSALRAVIVGDARAFEDALRRQGMTIRTIRLTQLDLDAADLRSTPAR
ncbi:MAG: pitrilysin family protein [Gammaproteobacteria bacterium]|nr:pitrilysin family protein [Gammaproteobacteria bacterium]